jgi:DNA-binding response OmpR family regulator
MIMLLTHRQNLREQLNKTLQASGYSVTIPPHREDMVTVLNESKPQLIVLDLYLSDPCGAEDLKILRDQGYQGAIIVLSGTSMMPVLKEVYPSGIESVVPVPTKINGQYQLGELQSIISGCMRGNQHALIAQRAYELYEAGGYNDGHDMRDWLHAEQEITMRCKTNVN